jgi:hypothetical protein
MYPGPLTDTDVALEQALDIALDYLEFTGQAEKFVDTQRIAADTILMAWRAGTRHRITLVNYAITAVETKRAVESTPSIYLSTSVLAEKPGLPFRGSYFSRQLHAAWCPKMPPHAGALGS